MKKKIGIFLGMVAVLFFFPAIALLAQEIPVPETWTDIILNFNVWFQTFYGAVVFTAFVAAVFTGLLKAEKNFHKQLIAWAVAIIALVLCRVLGWGYVAEFPYYQVIIHGFAAGLASNGFFKVPGIKGILDDIDAFFGKLREGKEKEDEE